MSNQDTFEINFNEEDMMTQIRLWSEGKRTLLPGSLVETVDFLLSELDSSEEENRKLREDIERIIEILKNGQQAHWQTFKIRQLLEVPLE